MSTEQLNNCGIQEPTLEKNKAGSEVEEDEMDLPLARLRDTKEKERDASPTRKSSPKKAKASAKPLTKEQLERHLEEALSHKAKVKEEDKMAKKALREAEAAVEASPEAKAVLELKKKLREAQEALRQAPVFAAVDPARMRHFTAKQAVAANKLRRCQLNTKLAGLKKG
jgi:hypothetical protein